MPVLRFENPLFRASFKHPLSWFKTIRTILIWDNSERYPDCQSIDQLKLSVWKTLEFYGLGPINAYATKTTLLFRNNLPNALH